MTKQEKFDAIKNAYTTKERGDETIAIIDDKTDTEIRLALLNIHRGLDQGVNFDLSYEIMRSATLALNTIDNMEQLNDLDRVQELANGTASVYTGVQLSWLTPSNQYDISEYVKDGMAEDIAQACAMWYESKVDEAINAIIAYMNA